MSSEESDYENADKIEDDDERLLEVALKKSTDIGRNGCTRPERYLAACIDNISAVLIVVCVAATVSEVLPSSKNPAVNVLLGLAVGAVYFVYFVLFESLTSTTPGKFMFGLHVESLDGTRCDFRAALIRTVFRLIEVNPVSGCLPAAIVVRCSTRRQRWGDMLAGTIVTDLPRSRMTEATD